MASGLSPKEGRAFCSFLTRIQGTLAEGNAVPPGACGPVMSAGTAIVQRGWMEGRRPLQQSPTGLNSQQYVEDPQDLSSGPHGRRAPKSPSPSPGHVGNTAFRPTECEWKGNACPLKHSFKDSSGPPLGAGGDATHKVDGARVPTRTQGGQPRTTWTPWTALSVGK